MRYLTVIPHAATSDSIITGADPTKVDTANPLRLFIIQAAIIITVTRLLGYALQKIRQPRVIAEVIGGILLGPTVMGHVPGFTKHIFPPLSLPFLNLVATLGLVLFLFLVGLEVDLRVVKRCAKESTMISVAGMILPFGLGAAVSVGIYREFIDTNNVSLGHFILFTGVAMAITAFPVLARILTELKLLQTKVGVIVLAAGVGNDVVGWILLALTVALVNASTGLTALYVLLAAVGWTLVLFLLIKPAFVWLARRTGSFENGPTQLMMTLTILLVLVSAWVTDVIGVHPIFGSFLVGLMIPHDGGYAVAMTEKIEDLVSVIFLPLYFALSGLKTNLGSLDTGIIWGYTICIIVIAFVSKFVGCAGAARLCGFNWRESTAVGTLMSCKGLVELIVLNIGLSAGVLDTRVFSMFVVMAIVSTVATTPLTLLAYPERVRTKLDDVGLHSHHGAAIDDGANAPDEKDSSESADGARGGLAAKRLLVVLDRFEHLPALMTLVQLMQPFHASNGVAVQPPSGLCRRAVSSDAKDRSEGTEDLMDDGASSKGEANNAEEEEAITHSTPVLSSGAPFASAQLAVQPGISIDALRLIELTERTSAVMKVSESEDTMRADPLINVFRTFGHLHHVPVRSSMAILSQDDFAGTVATRARDAAADLVVVPYTFVGGAATQESSAVVSSPFESIFGKSSGGDGGQSRSSPQQAQFVRRVFQDAPCDVGLYVDRPTSTQPAALPLAHLGRAQHILLGFGGGPDDRAALRFVVRLCTANPTLSATVLRLRRVSPEESGDAAVPSVPPTVHHNMSLQQGMTVRSANNMDTVYPSHNPQSALEATLEDDLAIRAAEENAPARIELRTVSSARPLRELIRAAEAAQPSLLVVGRGRRQPTLTHREELRYLLHAGVDGEVAAGEAGAGGRDRDRALNGEQTKMVGEAAMALSLAKCAARILVLCASSRRVDEEEIRVA